MAYRKNIIAGTVLALFSIVYLFLSRDIETFTGSGATPLDSTFMPRFWGVCLLILSSMLIVRGAREKKAALAAGEQQEKRVFSWKQIAFDNYEVILTFGAIAVYTAILQTVGFLIASALYIFVSALVLTAPGKRKPVVAASVAVVAAVLIDYLFVVMLNVMLPKGFIGF